MVKLIWITVTAMIYSTTMTVDYTADGQSVLIDREGYEWIYDREVPGEKVNVMLYNNGTPDIDDDIIVAVEEVINL